MFHLTRLQKLYLQTFLTFLFFILESVVGYMYGSISLVADSFHMMSDLLGLGVAIYAIRLASRTSFSDQLSFGFQRAEVLGALTNAVFLLALCFTIYMEAIQRFFIPHEIDNPKMVLIVGSCGALVNIVGVFMFGGHHHDGPDEPKLTKQEEETLVKAVFSETASRTSIDLPDLEALSSQDLYQKQFTAPPMVRRKSSMITIDIDSGMKRPTRRPSTTSTTSTTSTRILGKPADGGHLNMHGVFLHMLGDLLGSLAVIVSSLVMWLATSWESRWIMDPITSILITTAVIAFTIPLARTSARILLQATPGHLSHGVVKRALLLVPNVAGVHELHMWQLSDTKTVASAHIRVRPDVNVLETIRAVKEVLCGFGICSVTVQPEQLTHDDLDRMSEKTTSSGHHHHDHAGSGCLVRCSRPECQENHCCSEERVRAEDHERVTYGGFWFGVGPAAAIIQRARRESQLVARQRQETRRTSRGWLPAMSPVVESPPADAMAGQAHQQSQARQPSPPGSSMRRRSSAMLEQIGVSVTSALGQARRSVHFREG